jgi:hypothetical protein
MSRITVVGSHLLRPTPHRTRRLRRSGSCGILVPSQCGELPCRRPLKPATRVARIGGESRAALQHLLSTGVITEAEYHELRARVAR